MRFTPTWRPRTRRAVEAPAVSPVPASADGRLERLATLAAFDDTARHDTPVLRNSAALVVNSMATASLGVLFLILAARHYSAATVGASSAVISLILFLASVAELNLTSVLARFLPTSGNRASGLLLRAYVVAAILGFAAGLIALPFTRNVSLMHRFVDLGPKGILWFASAVSVWCIFALQDAAAIALRGSLWVPIENAAFGIAKILVLVALAASSPTFGVIASWTVPMALVLVPMNLLIFKVLIPAHVARGGLHERVTTRQLGSFAAVEYLTSLASTAGSTLVPLIVVARVGGDSGGYFYVVWAIGASIETALNSIGTSLVVEGARNPDRLDAIARALSRRVFVLAVPCLAIGITLSHFLLSVFGSEYARHSTTLLRLMLVGALPRSVVVLWMSMNRVTRRIGRVLLAQTLLSGSMIVLISLSVSHNGHTDAVGVAYLVCQAVVALVVLPDFVRGLRAAPLSATASGAN